MIILGVFLIAIGIFGKIRPDIIYRNYDKKTAFGGVKTQNEGSLTPPCIVWKNLQIPHTV